MYSNIEAICILIFIITLVSMIKDKQWEILLSSLGLALFVGLMIYIQRQFGIESVLICVGILFVIFFILVSKKDNKN